MKIEILKDLFMVAGGRYGFTHPCNCNVYLIRDEKGMALIDAGCGLDLSLIDSIINYGFNPKDIKLIINTHAHWDHARGDRDVQKISGCNIAVHADGAPVIENGSWYNLEKAPAKVTINLKDGDEINLGKYALKVIHTPGHSRDSICLLLRSEGKNILFTGDTAGAWGQLGVMNVEINFKEYRNSIEKLLATKPDVLLPGHGIFVVSEATQHIIFLLEKLEGPWEDLVPFPSPEFGRIRSRYIKQK